MSSSIKSRFSLGFPWKTQDPFIFCVHHEDAYPKGNEVLGPVASLAGRNLGKDFAPNKEGWRMYHGRKVPGFPAHPHCGFETVTIVTKGVVDHSDSLGAAGRFGYGDVQWMTAGKGVQHCEMFPLLNKDRDNPLELFQIWLNLPRKSKKADPHFSMLWSDTIPSYQHRDTSGRHTEFRVIAGKIGDAVAPAPAPNSWAADECNEVAIWTITMDPHATVDLPISPVSVNRTLYFYKGESFSLDGTESDKFEAFELHADRVSTLKAGSSTCKFVLLQGKPIAEPVVQYGPFVVNSQEEIQHVMGEYQKSQFGGWPWSSYENVHDRSEKRFAKYPDGKLETRELID